MRNKVQLDLSHSPTTGPPSMHGWHGKRHDCMDYTLDLIMPIPAHVEGGQ